MSSEPLPLSAQELEARLDDYLEVELSFRNAAVPAQTLAALTRDEQEHLLRWVQRVASSNVELAYQFALRAASALQSMAPKMVEAWALHAMDTYDRAGLRPALEVIRTVEGFALSSRARAAGAVFEEVVGVLFPFVHGLSGRKLKLEEGDGVYTDTEVLFLPPMLARLQDSDSNFRLYKAMAAHLWAQTRYGTYRNDLSRRIEAFRHPDRALAVYHALETIRLDARIESELPGLAREMKMLKHHLGRPALPVSWLPAASQLREKQATAEQSLDWVARLYDGPVPEPVCYQGQLRPALALAVHERRLQRERTAFRAALRHIVDDARDGRRQAGAGTRFERHRAGDPSKPEDFRVELTLDGQPLVLPDEVRNLMTSIVQDLGDVPQEYLVPAGPAEYEAWLRQQRESDADEVWQGTYHEEGAALYDEWDYRRQHYRKNWCAVREKEVSPVHDGFVARALSKHGGLVRHLRKTFEAMRDEDRLLKRQPHGDGIDIDALVEALADAWKGSEMSERLFTRLHRSERNIAVVFMVDMSGSTKGWINDAERESLALLCEALESLGDRYAIYGFSGMTRKRCEIYRVKAFDEAYNASVQARISGIRPRDYTRMGFAIRHLSGLLAESDARVRILITLSDGKPDDYDNYRGEYGIEDTRRALLEARRKGIHPYCITIDSTGASYLPRMYGPAGYTVIDDVRKLPYKVADIYRRLTT